MWFRIVEIERNTTKGNSSSGNETHKRFMWSIYLYLACFVSPHPRTSSDMHDKENLPGRDYPPHTFLDFLSPLMPPSRNLLLGLLIWLMVSPVNRLLLFIDNIPLYLNHAYSNILHAYTFFIDTLSFVVSCSVSFKWSICCDEIKVTKSRDKETWCVAKERRIRCELLSDRSEIPSGLLRVHIQDRDESYTVRK